MRKLETDLERGEKGVLKTGSLVEALRATMSYPGLFAPACIKGRWFVDGGVVDPVPVGAARAMGAGVVIAVDLNSRIVSRNADLHPVVSIEKVQEPLRGGNK
nr:patatin-like phospholipase family protein [Desulfosediminicola flagellatus]